MDIAVLFCNKLCQEVEYAYKFAISGKTTFLDIPRKQNSQESWRFFWLILPAAWITIRILQIHLIVRVKDKFLESTASS